MSLERQIGVEAAARQPLGDEAPALPGSAFGQYVFEFAYRQALQLNLSGRGRPDNTHFGSGLGIDGGNFYVSTDSLEFENYFALLVHMSIFKHLWRTNR